MMIFKRYILTCAVSLLTVICSSAQKNVAAQVDPSTLDFGTNMTVPEVPLKQVAQVRAHMCGIYEALSHIGFDTHYSRDKEVVTVVIPCSEFFAPNETVLKNVAKSKLDHFTKMLQYPTMYKILVAVYSDDTGEPQYCDELTSARANAIDDYLIDLAHRNNITNVNVVPYGMGQSDMLVDNNSVENRASNRRVEIYIIPEYEMIQTAKAGKLVK